MSRSRFYRGVGKRWGLWGANIRTLALPIPVNYDFTPYGDSRTEDGLVASAATSGYLPIQSAKGYAGFLVAASGGRLKPGLYGNFGIAGGTSVQAAVEPRLSSTSFGAVATAGAWHRGSQTGTQATPTGGGSDNKGFTYAKNHSAGFIFLLLGTNTDGDYAVATRNNILTILAGFGTSKPVVILNETPKGILMDGSISAGQIIGSTQAFKDYSAWLLTLDRSSGSPNARSNVIVVDLWSEFADPAYDTAAAGYPGTYVNKAGYLRDGLHFSHYGALRAAEVICARLAVAYGTTWTSLANRIPIPTRDVLTNNLTNRTAGMPFLNSNPILTAGSNGTVSGTFGSAPAASTVPQGWTLLAGTNCAGLTIASAKGGTDAEGYKEWVLTVSGTIPANSDANFILSQVVPYTTYESDGLLGTGDVLKAMSRYRIDTGSQNHTGLQTQLFWNGTPVAASQLVTANAITTQGNGLVNNGTLDGGGRLMWAETEQLDMDNANLAAFTPTLLQLKLTAGFSNNTGASVSVSGTLRISLAGAFCYGA